MKDQYHPIRQKMVWVLIIQSVASALVLAGVATETLAEDWTQWTAGVINILVLGGVLAKGTTEAEESTTPLDEQGDPLNPDYIHSPMK